MKILSICSTEYNFEQAKGIIYWLNGNEKSNVIRIPNIKNLFCSYFILLIYFVFLRWFTFIKFNEPYNCVIVTGKSVVAQAIIIADQLNIPLRCVQKPFGYPWFLFEYMYVPYHDIGKFPANNQIITYISPNTMKFSKNIKKEKKISILIGGNVHNRPFDYKEIIKTIKHFQKKIDYELEIITSRRTPIELLEKIKRMKLIINDIYGSTKNAYYHSEILLITDDSFSMISEAVQSGIKPLIIKTTNPSIKLRKGVDYLIDLGLVKYFII